MVINQSEIEAAIGANISGIKAWFKPGEPTFSPTVETAEPTFSPTVGTAEPTFSPTVGTVEPAAKQWKWIAIGGSVGGVALVIVVIIVWRW